MNEAKDRSIIVSIVMPVYNEDRYFNYKNN